MRTDVLVVDCEGGRIGGGLCGRTYWWWTVRTGVLVVDCEDGRIGGGL